MTKIDNNLSFAAGPNMRSNLEVVKEFCKLLTHTEKSDDAQSYLGLCHENITWPSTTNVSEGGICVGKKQMFEEYLPRFLASFKDFRGVYEEFLDARDTIVALGKYEITSKSGEYFVSPFAQIFAVRDGKIAMFRQYSDSATIQRARMAS